MSMFSSSKNKSDAKPVLMPAAQRQIDTVIAEHCTVEGNLTSENSVKVDGTVQGALRSQGRAIIGETGLVKGDVHSPELLVIGRLEGNVTTENLHLQANAVIVGNIDTRTLQVDPGARYSGTVTMREDPPPTTPPALPPVDSGDDAG